MTASSAGTPAGRGTEPGQVTPVSGETPSPWLKILGLCSAACGVLLTAAAVVAWLLNGPSGAGSVAFAGCLVIAFFGLSLLVGHFVGRKNPSGALGMFVVTYVVKVVGFAVALFAMGQPAWLEGTWFFGAAVGTVLVWQICEVIAFSKTRYLLYGSKPSGEAS
ncbi:MAG TPA: hypothetical protein VFI97_01135 [Arthrobacter sp.]|nr:hypothetical protein [Arthrobacter sp.]